MITTITTNNNKGCYEGAAKYNGASTHAMMRILLHDRFVRLALLLWTVWHLPIRPTEAFVGFPSSITPARAHHRWKKASLIVERFQKVQDVVVVPRTTTVTNLFLVMEPSSFAASMALVGSSFLGMQLDRYIPSTGILGTLTTAALISNVVPLVPSSHRLYDLCWSWILPGSLAMLLLGYNTSTNKDMDSSDTGITTGGGVFQAIARVAGPFVLASMGSILGCWAAYRLALLGRWFSCVADARAATSCLAASYVGGSVNLFATAKIIQAPSSLLSSMATADLIAMALYFSILSSTLEWKWLRSLFGATGNNETNNGQGQRINRTTGSTPPSGTQEEIASLTTTKSSLVKTLPIFPLLLGLTFSVVGVANAVESRLSHWIPGTACGVIAILAPLVRSLLQYNKKRMSLVTSTEWSTTASTLADWLFLVFFASIGVGVDLTATLKMGPACLLVSVLALAVHLLVTVVGSKLLLPTRRYNITLEDLWIASNAAIGGPATAAAFSNRMKHNENLWGRTVAATVWGVVGYAVGTLIGVGLYRFLGGVL